jgi:antitoxin component YwqK of YwqJK toxin-antitoxin module
MRFRPGGCCGKSRVNMKGVALIGLMMIFLVTSCHKKEVLKTAEPEAVIKTTSIQFRVAGVPQKTEQLYALVSLQNSSDEDVLLNRKIALHFRDGKYVTDSVPVSQGGYRLSRLLITAGSDTALYATPKLQSPRQYEVNTPLSHPVTVKQQVNNTIDVQTLLIRNTDTPESFGYTEEEFGYVAFLKVKVHLSMTVGNQKYDSLSGTLKIDAVHANGTHWRREIVMTPGMNTVSVPEKYYSFEFAVEKWLVRPKKTLVRSEVPGAVVELTATRNAKQLMEESTFIESQGLLNPENRTEYVYNAGNMLTEINVFGKVADKPGLQLTQKSRFVFHNGVLDSINRYTDSGKQDGSLAIIYANGKITSIRSKSGGEETAAAFTYAKVAGLDEIGARYVYPNGNTMTYNMRYRQGNLVSDAAFSSTGGSESGEYRYDENINPYQQLNIPDLFLSRLSKNNRIAEEKLYGGGFPTSVPYKFEYAYDADGYPSELWTSFRGYTSGSHLFRIKKVFRYR